MFPCVWSVGVDVVLAWTWGPKGHCRGRGIADPGPNQQKPGRNEEMQFEERCKAQAGEGNCEDMKTADDNASKFAKDLKLHIEECLKRNTSNLSDEIKSKRNLRSC